MIGSARQIAEFIREHDDFIVITHILPDGDAQGSERALVLMLRALGKRAFAACDDKWEERLSFMPLNDEIAAIDTMPFEPGAALSVDVASIERLGKLREVFERCPARAVIDHHGTNEGFAPVCYIDGNCAATGEMVLRIMEELGIALTREMAECIYTAVSTDSGNFSFSCTNASSFYCAAKCMEAGIDIEELTRKLYRSRSFAKTKLIGSVLEGIELKSGGKLACAPLTLQMLEKIGATEQDAHNIVNYLNEIEGVKIGILGEEKPYGAKFSFRGTPGVDVSALAALFGGGGHKAAAGATLRDRVFAEAYAEVTAKAEEFLKKL